MNGANDIEPENSKGGRHGYHERYWSFDRLLWRGVFVNNREHGYHKSYSQDGSVQEDWTGYFLDGNNLSLDNAEGYCYVWSRVEL